jgi:hypothetical protein
MAGCLRDAWCYTWQEIWIPLEQSEIWSQLADSSGYTTNELYMDLYVELAKALKKAPQPTVHDVTANNPVLARNALEALTPKDLRSETATARFFENAAQVIAESGSNELSDEFGRLIAGFLQSRNLRYELLAPFELRSRLPGVFEALMLDVVQATQQHPQLAQALLDFSHSFHLFQRTHAEPDIKTLIHKAAMLAEALASNVPEARGNNFTKLCDSIDCWPNPLVREAVKKLYEFSSDFPGIRHNIIKRNASRTLELRDAVLVPVLLLTAAGYFGASNNVLDTLRSQDADPPQQPADPPEITQPAEVVALP